jgi:hypothetical protein
MIGGITDSIRERIGFMILDQRRPCVLLLVPNRAVCVGRISALNHVSTHANCANKNVLTKQSLT